MSRIAQRYGASLAHPKQIRALGGPVAGVPAIAVTAYTGSRHREMAGEAGFETFCSKPVSPEDVAAAIRNVTSGRVTPPPD